MTRLRKSVLWGSLGLLAAWILGNFARLTGDQDGLVRFVLGSLFAALILFRPKEANGPAPARRPLLVAGIGLLAAVLAVSGIVFQVHQFEWLGIVLLLYACLRWALPDTYAGDILRALCLLYWVHPLPGRLFGELQLAMQRWSVAGAEWTLHGFNYRVWADGFFLYTGFDVVGVPEACSGMRTAVTTLLSGLGIGLLYRFRLLELVGVAVVGLAQVLLLNIIRISAVVAYAPKMPPEWSDNFLHDTLGIFLLVAVVLVQLEAMAWQVWKVGRRRRAEGIANATLERPERASRYPRFWQLLFRGARIMTFTVLLSLLVVATVYKSRPAHREQMRRDVIDGLMETDLQVAERALEQVLRRHPKDQELLARKARVQVMRRDYQAALNTFDAMGVPLSPFLVTLKSWSLMALGRADEAVQLIDALPEQERHLPGVAMVRAEYAAIQGDPVLTSKYIVYAGNSTIDPERVRALFPYLARHEQWEAIARADSDRPYKEIGEALIVAHACLRCNELDGAARTLRHALRQWKYDPRFLRHLFVLASRRPGSEWEDHFAASFTANYVDLSVDQIVPYIAYCFQLSRPDLAWLAYLRLLELDSRDPDVFYTPAQFGSKWFIFRRHQIGVRGDDRGATIDLRPLFAHTRHLWPLDRLWDRLPLEKELSGRDLGPVRERYMKWTLAELENREKNRLLSRRGELIYPAVLASEGRYEEAHQRLDRIRDKFPIFTPQVLLEHAQFYDQEKRWEKSYEALHEYYLVTDLIELPADLLMVNTLLNLNMAVYAMEVANRASQTFPGVGYTDLLRAAIWEIFGYKDQALFTLGSHEDDIFLQTAARLNLETGRIREADRIYGALGMRFDRTGISRYQSLLPLPADVTVVRRWSTPPSADELDKELVDARRRLTNAVSPFVKGMESLTVAWYETSGAASASDAARWAAVGRDELEQGTVLHRLVVLLARQQRFEQAAAVAKLALTKVPQSAVLQRILIALTEGDPQVVADGRRACPQDPEIWLASLVVHVRTAGAGDWALAEARQAVASGSFSVDALVRAGDYCLRNKMPEAARFLAKAAIPDARGLISAYMLGLRCALDARDATWAMECAHLGIAHALDPGLFYRAIVRIKSIQETPDADLITALEYLNEHFPKESEWAQYLGQVYFQRGDSSRALTILDPLISQELSGVRVRSLLLAAEAARVTGYDAKAIDILERALAQHQDQMSILNNLIYNLVQNRDTAPRARELLPRLLEMNDESFAVLDTAAMVYLKNGDLERAQYYMDRALAAINEEDYAALETRLNAAELLLARGQLDQAGMSIGEIRRDPRISNFLDLRARHLMDEVQRRRQEDQ